MVLNFLVTLDAILFVLSLLWLVATMISYGAPQNKEEIMSRQPFLARVMPPLIIPAALLGLSLGIGLSLVLLAQPEPHASWAGIISPLILCPIFTLGGLLAVNFMYWSLSLYPVRTHYRKHNASDRESIIEDGDGEEQQSCT